MKQRNNISALWATGGAILLALVAVACQPSGAVGGTTMPPPATATLASAGDTHLSPVTTAVAPTSSASPTAAPAASPGPTRLTPVVPVVPLPVPTSAQGPVIGQVPEVLFEAIYQDAQSRTGVARAQISLLRAEAVVWRDGSLGCPQPGMMYTQALAPGYWVVLEAGGRELDYHASRSGTFVLCESGMPRQEPLPGGEDQ